MKSTRKTKAVKSKAKKKSEGKQRKAHKANAKKGNSKNTKAQEPTANGTSGKAADAAPRATQPKSEKALRSLIKSINVPSLHDDDIAAILTHCKSVLDFRRTVSDSTLSWSASSSGKCYRKAGDSSIVSIYEGFFKVGTMSEESAKAQGIPRCG
jgi:hypothetical protein